ncbi:MAG: hypothetical protein IJM37_01890 [Lachnospiraceae bacterium]|nr:hypothetical protein [Lachnospiraceae bacterium]
MPDFLNPLEWLGLPTFSDMIDFFKGIIIAGILGSFEELGNFHKHNILMNSLYSSLGKSPSEWNTSIFSAITGMAENVLMIVAAVIISFVITYDLVQSVSEHNSKQDFEISILIKWLAKSGLAVYLVSNSMTIVNGIFTASSWIIEKASSYLYSDAALNPEVMIEFYRNSLQDKSIFSLFLIQAEILTANIAVIIVMIVAEVIIWSRMIEIFMVIAASPIPFATLMNRDWSDIGRNYIKLICAYGFQAYLIMIIFAVYSALIGSIAYSDSITSSVITLITYTFLFGYMLFKTEAIAKSIFCAR